MTKKAAAQYISRLTFEEKMKLYVLLIAIERTREKRLEKQ